MFAIVKKIRNRKNEGGSAIMLFLFMSVVIGAVLLSLVYGTINTTQSSASIRDATFFDLGAKTAINDALRVANNPKSGENLANHVGEAKAVKGVLEGNQNVDWEWYLLPVPNTEEGTIYDVHATGYRGTKNPETARKIIGRLESVQTSGARWVDDTVYYRPTQSSIFSWGAFGGDGLEISPNTRIGSYDSAYAGSKNVGTIGTNKIANLPNANQTRIDNLLLSAGSSGVPLQDRCVGESCKSVDITKMEYGLDLSIVDEWVNKACEGITPIDVSGNRITLDVTKPNCFNNIVFDGNVQVNWVNGMTPSSGRPVKIYVQGMLAFTDGTYFNTPAAGSGAAQHSPTAIQFFVNGLGVRVGLKSPHAPNPETDVRALIAAGKSAICAVGDPASQSETNFYGALVCNSSLMVFENSTILWDEQTKHLEVLDNDENLKIWDYKGLRNELG